MSEHFWLVKKRKRGCRRVGKGVELGGEKVISAAKHSSIFGLLKTPETNRVVFKEKGTDLEGGGSCSKK